MPTSQSTITPLAKPPVWTPPSPLPARFDTARLVLRWYEPSDAAALFDVVTRSRSTMLPWLPWAASDHRSIEESIYNIEWFRRGRSNWDDAYMNIAGYVVGAFEKSTGKLIGGTGLNRFTRSTHNAETGYWVDAALLRRGYCTEMTAGILSWAFTPQNAGGFGLRRVHIFAAANNIASCGVPRKLGLRQEIHTLKDRWVDGIGLCDTLGWGVLADEWDCGAQCLRR